MNQNVPGAPRTVEVFRTFIRDSSVRLKTLNNRRYNMCGWSRLRVD